MVSFVSAILILLYSLNRISIVPSLSLSHFYLLHLYSTWRLPYPSPRQVYLPVHVHSTIYFVYISVIFACFSVSPADCEPGYMTDVSCALSAEPQSAAPALFHGAFWSCRRFQDAQPSLEHVVLFAECDFDFSLIAAYLNASANARHLLGTTWNLARLLRIYLYFCEYSRNFHIEIQTGNFQNTFIDCSSPKSIHTLF